jgi:tRNA A-37 threonylcarbamoyl transferase component Bud32
MKHVESYDVETYTKCMSHSELIFLKLASEADIAPKILSVKNKSKDTYIVTMEKYPYTLSGYYCISDDRVFTMFTYRGKINDLIDKLHSIDILHGDLHGGNIVINPKTEDVRLIDFGQSYFIHEITPHMLREISLFLNEKFSCVKEAMVFEKKMYFIDM